MKIVLIEDRQTRQELFALEFEFRFEQYSDILDNIILDNFSKLASDIIDHSFDLSQYSIIISHKSVQIEDRKDSNNIIISRLKEYCKKHNKILVLFSGGNPISYYDNSEFELLELNSKVFYSQNLSLFLDATRNNNQNILMLCYGENWKLNIISNILEKTNIFIHKSIDEDIDYNEFISFIDMQKLNNFDTTFYNMKVEEGWVYLSEIIRFRNSIYSYFDSLNENININETLNKVLIHNNNTFDLNSFKNRIRFKMDNKGDIDSYISNDIIKQLKEKDCEKIYIKDNLSSNYLELYGLRVAFHIRLSSNLNEKKYLPIIIISDFTREILMRFSELANIFFTKNIFLISNTNDDFKKIDKNDIPPMSKYDYQINFLNKIKIEPPQDYISQHSIANEWSIYRWGEFLKVDSLAIKKNKAKIEDMLYFKYLVSKNPIEITKGIKFAAKSPQASGKILYIEDQWNEGWSDIFNKYFSESKNIDFDTFEYQYKDKNKFTILKDIKNEIVLKNPDIVLLDLRLTQNDHDHIRTLQDIERLTGIKVLNTIKTINKGIQVIMITASNQTLILEKLYSFGILGYIKKEHPSDISVNTKDHFIKLNDLIEDGFKNKYLKDIWTIQNNILNFKMFTNNSNDKINDIKLDVNSIFEILDSKMKSSNNLAIITFTKILENISSLYINEYTMRYKDDDTNVGIYDYKENIVYDFDNEKWYKNTQNRIHNIVYEKLNLTQKDIHIDICELINCRNYLAHPNEKKPQGCNLITEPSDYYILKWFNIIKNILNVM
jgi:CheY-like chemotaxis protein